MLLIKNLSFSYGKNPVLKNLNFKIEKGQNVSIIGASGCGKSTLLQAIYGLHHVEGTIIWDNQKLLGPNFNIVPGEDFIKYLTQDFDLMPPLTVAENVGKYLSNAYPRKKKQRVKELLQLVEMQDMANVKAKHLSGGQQQRVALARVLAKPPEILLLDEPFSHIDHFRKNKLRRNLFKHLKTAGITVLVATHDSTDALAFADTTLAMESGKIVEMGSPEQLYNKPKNAYVASLFGEVNELPASFFFEELPSRKKIILYPHEVVLSETGAYQATVKNSFFRGSNFLTEAEFKGETILFESLTPIDTATKVKFEIDKELLLARVR